MAPYALRNRVRGLQDTAAHPEAQRPVVPRSSTAQRRRVDARLRDADVFGARTLRNLSALECDRLTFAQLIEPRASAGRLVEEVSVPSPAAIKPNPLSVSRLIVPFIVAIVASLSVDCSTVSESVPGQCNRRLRSTARGRPSPRIHHAAAPATSRRGGRPPLPEAAIPDETSTQPRTGRGRRSAGRSTPADRFGAIVCATDLPWIVWRARSIARTRKSGRRR